MGKCWNIRFHGKCEDLGLKCGTHSCLDEYMKICENKMSMSFFGLRARTLIV